MKQKKFEIIISISLLIFPLCAQEKRNDDFLAGSVVKSEKWEIDRARNMEIFQGSVTFKNFYYELKADSAVYDKARDFWKAAGAVSCKRNFEDGTSVISFCDRAIYSNNMERAIMESVKNPVKSIYTLKDGRKITTLSKKLRAENSSKTVEFEDNFSVYNDSSVVIGERGLFKAETGDFIITGGQPLATGENEKYQLYMEGEIITLNRDSGLIKAQNRVKGVILNKNKEK
ncbi:MAG: hypothetical protein Fur0012_09820 [Elusimicrobiota bacterium]